MTDTRFDPRNPIPFTGQKYLLSEDQIKEIAKNHIAKSGHSTRQAMLKWAGLYNGEIDGSLNTDYAEAERKFNSLSEQDRTNIKYQWQFGDKKSPYRRVQGPYSELHAAPPSVGGLLREAGDTITEGVDYAVNNSDALAGYPPLELGSLAIAGMSKIKDAPKAATWIGRNWKWLAPVTAGGGWVAPIWLTKGLFWWNKQVGNTLGVFPKDTNASDTTGTGQFLPAEQVGYRNYLIAAKNNNLEPMTYEQWYAWKYPKEKPSYAPPPPPKDKVISDSIVKPVEQDTMSYQDLRNNPTNINDIIAN